MHAKEIFDELRHGRGGYISHAKRLQGGGVKKGVQLLPQSLWQIKAGCAVIVTELKWKISGRNPSCRQSPPNSASLID